MSAKELAVRVEALEVERDRLRDITRHLVGVVELLAEAAGAPLPAEAPPRPPTPVVCLFCFQVIADESDADLLKRLQAHSCPAGEQR